MRLLQNFTIRMVMLTILGAFLSTLVGGWFIQRPCIIRSFRRKLY